MVRIIYFPSSCRLWGGTGTFACDRMGKGVILVFTLVFLGENDGPSSVNYSLDLSGKDICVGELSVFFMLLVMETRT